MNHDFLDTVRIPQQGPGVCVVCYGTSGVYDLCDRCDEETLDDPIDSMRAMFYFPDTNQELSNMMYDYKSTEWYGKKNRGKLVDAWNRFVGAHEECVGLSFDRVAIVPSTQDPPRTFLRDLLTPAFDSSVIIEAIGVSSRRAVDASQFEILSRVSGSVLLIDDTWVSGSKARSMAAALKDAGAERVDVLVFARMLQPKSRHEDAEFIETTFLTLPRLSDGCPWGRCS